MKHIFSTTVGDDIVVTVEGGYDRGDASTGWPAGYSIDLVYLEKDRSRVDIQSLLSDAQLDRLATEGHEYSVEGIAEERECAAEYRREASRDAMMRGA
jgi:hypothetical protein